MRGVFDLVEVVRLSMDELLIVFVELFQSVRSSSINGGSAILV